MIALEEAYPWLNKFEPSHISPSSSYLINQMGIALAAGHVDETKGLLQQLKELACKLRDEEEVTEVLIECAHGSYMLNDFKETESILADAVSRVWADLHRRAVIQWMLGCVQWRSFPSRQQAVISWRNSLSDFDRLTSQPGLSFEQHAWYQEINGRLEQSLLEALDQVGSYVDMDDEPSSGTPQEGFPVKLEAASVTPPHSVPKETLPPATATYPSDIIQLFTISEEIPAGDFGPSGIDPFPIGTVELDHLSINGRPYSIHSTRGRKIINLPFDQKLSVVKVKGDSMDLENITMQDYVILRRVDVPTNGDIIMAEIVGIDTKATLKRYYKEKDTITLKPHSSNPAHQPFVFKKVNEGFFVRGVVIAVLKPV